jgi:hypothetical protein
VDGSFGVTSRIFLAEMTPWGRPLGTIEVPADELVTSFSSKSELALNLSPDGRTVSFMGYVTKPDNVDVSNSNTPGVTDPANPVPGASYRAVAQLSGRGQFQFTETNAYSGNNGRAAIHNNVLYYTKGSGGNGVNTVYFLDTTGQACPDGVGLPAAGAQLPTSPCRSPTR